MTENILFADPATITTVREENFAATMDLVAERHPWYRRLMTKRGLARGDFGSLSDIAKLPVTEKRDDMSAPEDFRLDTTGLAPEMSAPWDVMYTTGTTTGRPMPLYSTTGDFYDIVALQRGMLELPGVGQDRHYRQPVPADRLAARGVANHIRRVLIRALEIFKPGDTLKPKRFVDLRSRQT